MSRYSELKDVSPGVREEFEHHLHPGMPEWLENTFFLVGVLTVLVSFPVTAYFVVPTVKTWLGC